MHPPDGGDQLDSRAKRAISRLAAETLRRNHGRRTTCKINRPGTLLTFVTEEPSAPSSNPFPAPAPVIATGSARSATAQVLSRPESSWKRLPVPPPALHPLPASFPAGSECGAIGRRRNFESGRPQSPSHVRPSWWDRRTSSRMRPVARSRKHRRVPTTRCSSTAA